MEGMVQPKVNEVEPYKCKKVLKSKSSLTRSIQTRQEPNGRIPISNSLTPSANIPTATFSCVSKLT